MSDGDPSRRPAGAPDGGLNHESFELSREALNLHNYHPEESDSSENRSELPSISV